MHQDRIEALARQRLAELRAARMSGHQVSSQAAGFKPGLVRQRLGWVLVQAGLRLAVRQART
jgi:hypothetical protein